MAAMAEVNKPHRLLRHSGTGRRQNKPSTSVFNIFNNCYIPDHGNLCLLSDVLFTSADVLYAASYPECYLRADASVSGFVGPAPVQVVDI